MRPIAFLAVLVLSLALAPPVLAADWTWPVRGDVVTQYRNGPDPYAAGQHRGIDITAPVGAAVVAATDGTVTFAGVAGSSGLTVSMRSGDGAYDLSYLHLSAAGVRKGDSVGRGDRIGAVGVSGRRSVEQPHLHFGVRLAGSATAYRDPLSLLPPLPAPTPAPEPPAAAPAPAPVEAPAATPPAAAAVPAPAAAAPAPSPAAVTAPAPAQPAASHHHAPSRPPATPTANFESGLHFAHGLAFEHRGHAAVAARPAAARHHGAGTAAGHARERAAEHRTTGRLDPLTGPRAADSQPALPLAGAVKHGAPARHLTAAKHDAGGVDVGWLAALLGLLAAALCLGRPDASARAARAGRARLVALVRGAGT